MAQHLRLGPVSRPLLRFRLGHNLQRLQRVRRLRLRRRLHLQRRHLQRQRGLLERPPLRLHQHQQRQERLVRFHLEQRLPQPQNLALQRRPHCSVPLRRQQQRPRVRLQRHRSRSVVLQPLRQRLRAPQQQRQQRVRIRALSQRHLLRLQRRLHLQHLRPGPLFQLRRRRRFVCLERMSRRSSISGSQVEGVRIA